MCKRKCELWCLRLTHWITDFRTSEQKCPKGCSRVVSGKETHAPQEDCMIAPGMGCTMCGGYWVPTLEADVVKGMAIEYAHGPRTPPTQQHVRKQFMQYADAAWRAIQSASAEAA